MDLQLFDYLQTYLTERRRKLFKEVLSKRTRHFTVATEGVYQLHNTSAVMRSCDVFGIQDLHVVEDIEGKRIDKEIAMGSQKWVSTYRYPDITGCISGLKDRGYEIVATTPRGDRDELQNFDITKKSAFFFGTESDGLSDIVMQSADRFLKIPMVGFTESLNISVSAAIILQFTTDKLRRSTIDWRLTPAEKLEIEMEWTKRSIKSADEIIEHFYEKKKQ